jgi:hypothetical protein
MVLGAISLVFRFRRAGGTERQQIKWLALSGSFVAVSFVLAPIYLWRSTIPFLWPVVFSIDILSIPLACGFAILRYRLYDIDRIISRTASYAVVSAILAGTFALAVLLPTTIVGSAAGGTPSWTIAVATLVVAVLFQPLRRRVQTTVDRRFNRARYDATRTIDAFSVRLRDEIDIDALGSELQDVVRRTMQPTHVRLWLTS